MHLWAVIVSTLAAAAAPAQINPFPRPVTARETVVRWTFAQGTAGWKALHACKVAVRDGRLGVECTGHDPYLHCRFDAPRAIAGQYVCRVRARGESSGSGSVFWSTHREPGSSPNREASFRLIHDNQWREYEVRFESDDALVGLRLDPGADVGRWEIEWLELVREELHPLAVEEVVADNARVRFQVHNYGPAPVTFDVQGRRFTAQPDAAPVVEWALRNDRPLETVDLEVRPVDGAPLRRTLFVAHPAVEVDWITLRSPQATLQVARDGSLARLRRGDKTVAVLGPLVALENRAAVLKCASATDTAARFEGDGVALALALEGSEVGVLIDSQRPCAGPIVRVLGTLRQGLLAGVEYLGRGDYSSSKLDIETPEHLRFAPDPLHVTMPLMAFVTDRGCVALHWDDMQLQPVFASPNFFDGTADHRMGLTGRSIAARLLVDDRSLEEAVVWAVKRRGLPPLPTPPRTPEQQTALCVQALNGPLRTADGWGHCVEDRWPRQPFAPMPSTLWRLTGEVPQLPKLVPGGAHVPNEAIYFVTGRAEEWLRSHRGRVAHVLKQQQADGSFRYDGPFARGHFENTANGICARPAVDLLEYARATGDPQALAAGLKAAEFLRRFDTPRGAQTWEIPLHTPDQLASAYAVWACVLAYELSGDKAHLAEARRWAITGVPFTYLWGCKPVMLYGTTPVLGATNWRAPNWIGLPVQWVGGVYAYALTKLAPHDRTLDWNHLARGIYIAAQQMQFPDGPNAGLLPDSFALEAQERRPWIINPCAIVSLQLALEGKLDSLAVAAGDGHRVVSPVPVVIRDGKAVLAGKKGLAYQVLVDGTRVVNVASQGEDTVDLAAK